MLLAKLVFLFISGAQKTVLQNNKEVVGEGLQYLQNNLILTIQKW